MNYSYNLVEEGWIPCYDHSQGRTDLGIRATLEQAHRLRALRGDTPLETAVLLRLLLAVLHRVWGPKDRNAWRVLWERGCFDVEALDAYLRNPAVFRRFDLFDAERPFFQALDPRVKADKSVISLVLHAASGNNSTLFSHSTEAVGLSLTPAQAARALLVAQAFGFGGLSPIPKVSFTDAPCADGTLFFVAGHTLFETLMLNLVQYDKEQPMVKSSDDRPAWEMDDPFQPHNRKPRGYLDYLTWQNRRVWLFPELEGDVVVVRRMRWAPGLALKVEAPDWADPMKHYLRSADGKLVPLRLSADKALWRDSSALFQLEGDDNPPAVIKWVAKLAGTRSPVLDEQRHYQVMAFGLAKGKKPADLEFMRAERIPLHLRFLTQPELVGSLAHALQSAKRSAAVLNRATFLLAWLLLDPKVWAALDAQAQEGLFKLEAEVDAKLKRGGNSKGQDHEARRISRLAQAWNADRSYWAELEPHFTLLITDLPEQGNAALERWNAAVRDAVVRAFARVQQYAGSEGRAATAAAFADQYFGKRLGALLGRDKADSDEQEGDEA
jgi:CRISPR system Cascade subunit CasA